jgi:hypothetical protein
VKYPILGFFNEGGIKYYKVFEYIVFIYSMTKESELNPLKGFALLTTSVCNVSVNRRDVNELRCICKWVGWVIEMPNWDFLTSRRATRVNELNEIWTRHKKTPSV